jgi:hypothetical protein
VTTGPVRECVCLAWCFTYASVIAEFVQAMNIVSPSPSVSPKMKKKKVKIDERKISNRYRYLLERRHKLYRYTKTRFRQLNEAIQHPPNGTVNQQWNFFVHRFHKLTSSWEDYHRMLDQQDELDEQFPNICVRDSYFEWETDENPSRGQFKNPSRVQIYFHDLAKDYLKEKLRTGIQTNKEVSRLIGNNLDLWTATILFQYIVSGGTIHFFRSSGDENKGNGCYVLKEIDRINGRFSNPTYLANLDAASNHVSAMEELCLIRRLPNGRHGPVVGPGVFNHAHFPYNRVFPSNP